VITAADQRELTFADKRVISAAADDTVADLSGITDGQQAVVSAWVLRELITGSNPKWRVKDHIQVTGATVRGQLDLAGAELAHALQFTDCVFKDRVDLRLARTQKPVEWDGGQTAAILADEFEAGSDLIIQNVTVTGLISLHWASVRGDLRLTRSRLVAAGGQVLNGKDLRVGGSLFLDGKEFRAEGEVCLRSAHVEGQIDCRHATFDNPLGCTINADHLVVDRELLCEEGFSSTGEVNLQWAKLGRLRATGGSFGSSTRYALHADAIRAEAGVYLDRDFHATATVRLVGANITGELCCTKGFFDNASGRALDAERVVAEDVYLDDGFRARGDVRFNDSQIARQFNASGGDFRNERRGQDQYALDCDGLRCDADVFLNDGFRAIGAVSLRGAEIKTELNCTAGSFTKTDGYALFADGMTTEGSVFLDGDFHADGEVRFARATVGRQLVCTDGTFSNPSGIALDISGLITPGDVLLGGSKATGEVLMLGTDITRQLDFTGARLSGLKGLTAQGMRAGCLTWQMKKPPEGPVDLSRARVTQLDDTFSSWPPGNYTLTGMTYAITADSEVKADDRVKWLRQTKEYSADAYQQLVQSYTLCGDQKNADRIAIESQRDLRDKNRGNLSRRSRAWNRFIDWFVGYGYKLHRPFIILFAAALAGGIVLLIAQHSNLIVSTTAPHKSAMVGPPAGIPPFYPFAYSFQLLIPGLDLRETANWVPNSAGSGAGLLIMVFVWLMIVFGWVLATALAAGVMRVFRRR
jgi:hypothetical protein